MTHFQVWNKSVHFRIRIFSGPLSQNSVWHLGHIGDFYGYPDPDPDAASLVLCSVGKLLGWSWRGKRLASFENRVNRFLPGWKTVSSRHLVGVCRLASTQGDQFCVEDTWSECAFRPAGLHPIHPNQGDQFWGDDTRQTNRCLLGKPSRLRTDFIHNSLAIVEVSGLGNLTTLTTTFSANICIKAG